MINILQLHIFIARLKQVDLVTKTDFDDKLKKSQSKN